jgi:hypothetical protein
MDQIGKKDIEGVQLTAECCANSQPAYSKQGDLLVSHLSLVFNRPSLIPSLAPTSNSLRQNPGENVRLSTTTDFTSINDFLLRTSKMLSSYILVGALAVMMASPSAGFHLQGMSLLHHLVVRLKRCAWSQRGQILSGGRRV